MPHFACGQVGLLHPTRAHAATPPRLVAAQVQAVLDQAQVSALNTRIMKVQEDGTVSHSGRRKQACT
jgi:hypothetical protein